VRPIGQIRPPLAYLAVLLDSGYGPEQWELDWRGKTRRPKVSFARCPDINVIRRFVSDNLSGDEAASLRTHLEDCRQCQLAVDALGGKPKSSPAHSAKAQSSESPSIRGQSGSEDETANIPLDELDQSGNHADSKTLDFTLEDQAKLSSPKSTARTTDSGPKNRKPGGDSEFALDDFIDCLKKSGLVHASEIELLVEQHEPPNSRSFAKALIKKQKLTKFQASALLQGRWKGLILGNYIVLEMLGEGGMGHVFKARHKRMGRIVCIKLLRANRRDSPEIVHRFRREARAVGKLKHPNIVVAHDADEAGGLPFLVMEYIDGPDLSQHVTDNGPMSPLAAIRSVRETAEALQYAHDQGVVHRDIKPHNLLLDGETTKVLDLGLARIESYEGNALGDTDRASLTSSDVLMGSVDYMPPEQALNCHNADARSDIYALGCTLHFLLTGEVVYAGATLMEKLIAHREQPTPSLADRLDDAPASLNKVFQRMMAKAPEDRYPDMASLAMDLKSLEQGVSPQEVEALPPLSQTSIPVPPVLADGESSELNPLPAIAVKKKRRRVRRRRYWTTGRVAIAAFLLIAIAGAILFNALATQ